MLASLDLLSAFRLGFFLVWRTRIRFWRRRDANGCVFIYGSERGAALMFYFTGYSLGHHDAPDGSVASVALRCRLCMCDRKSYSGARSLSLSIYLQPVALCCCMRLWVFFCVSGMFSFPLLICLWLCGGGMISISPNTRQH